MKLLDVEELHAGLKRNLNMLSRLEGKMLKIEKAITGLTNMEDSLKGQGGEALRNFYAECHLPFLQFFTRFNHQFAEIMTQISNELSALEPDQSGYIRQDYLEVDVEHGVNRAQQIAVELTNETNSIMDGVSDIVSLPHLDDSEVIEGVMNAKTHRNQTIHDLMQFDRTQTEALTVVEKDLKMMEMWIGNIKHSMVAGLTDVHFSTPTWKLLNFMTLTNPLFSTQMKLNEITRIVASKNLQKNLQAFSNGENLEITEVEDSKDSQDELDEIFKAIANGEGVVTTNDEMIAYMKEHNLLNIDSQIGPNGDYAITYEGMRRVLGGNGTGTPDGLAPYTVAGAKFLFEDMATIVDPNATIDERLAAAFFTFNKPAKMADKVNDVMGLTDKAANLAKVDKVQDVEKSGKGTGKYGADNIALHAKYKEVLKDTESANPIVDSLRQTGKLPSNYVNKDMAVLNGWKPGKALNNYVSGGQLGGDVFKNTTNVLPNAPGRVWYEADVGLNNTMARSKQPGSRLLYSNDGQMYITTDHYKTVHFIGTYK